MPHHEHIAHPDVWVEDPYYTMTLKSDRGESRTYGFDCMHPYFLETAILNRVADFYELEFLVYETWDPEIPVTLTQHTDPEIVWEANLQTIRDEIATELRKTKKRNKHYVEYHNRKQTIAQQQKETTEA